MRRVVEGSGLGCTYRRRIQQILQIKKTCSGKDIDIEVVNVHLIPSSSDDFTLAKMTSDANGRNTTILNTTEK